MASEILEQRRTPGALHLEPLQLLVAAVLVGEDPVRVLVEGLNIAHLRVGKAPHGDAANAIRALRIFVLPVDVVAGAGRQHLDVMATGEALGDQAAVILGSPEDLGAVPLHDECNLHDGTPVSSNVASSCRMRASPNSATRRRCPAMIWARR